MIWKGLFSRKSAKGDRSLVNKDGDRSDGGVDAEDLSYLFDPPPPTTSPVESQPQVDLSSMTLDETDFSSLNGPVAARTSLAAKLGRILPRLSRERRDQVFDLTCMALERLALDEALVVRVAVATAIKDVACAPPDICMRLARDIEAAVAEPILRCCVGINDSDLMNILQSKPPPWALAAIAKRQVVSAPISTALYQTGDNNATSLMLDNQGAVIADDTMDNIVEDAKLRTEWQGKLVRRQMLPQRIALRLAGYVDQAALELLRGRKDLDRSTAREIVKVARRRIDWLRATDPKESPDLRAARLFRKDALNEAAIEDAMSWKQYDFVRAALSVMSGVPPLMVEKLLQSRSGRAVTALAWRAELSMRTAFMLQKDLAGIPPSQYVYPRDGANYPMTTDELSWQLEFFGVPQRPSR
ncbi:MAG: DUF2336 domain-containing protein [Rhodospirillaceae bacterium]